MRGGNGYSTDLIFSPVNWETGGSYTQPPGSQNVNSVFKCISVVYSSSVGGPPDVLNRAIWEGQMAKCTQQSVLRDQPSSN